MAMDKSAADSYVYAKAGGMLAHSFVGRRASALFSVRSLHELWSLLFSTEVPAVPEAVLAKTLELQARDEFIGAYKKLIANYSSPAPVLVTLLHFFDYDNLKELGAALCMNERDMPGIVDTSPFSMIDYSAWPDIRAMTKNGPLAWYDRRPELSEQQENDYRLDVQYLRELWHNVQKTNLACRDALSKLVLEKCSLDNVLWALRLKTYYGMPDDTIREHLAYSTDARARQDVFAREALAILDWDTDSWDQWQRWRYARLLNPHEEGTVWSVDPRWVHNAFKKEYVSRALRMFHLYPFTECPLVCWFIIKRNELDAIRTVSEGLRMNVGMKDAMRFAGVTEESNG